MTVIGSMMLFRFLYRYSPKLVIWTSVAAVLSGACNMGLLAMMNKVVQRVAARDTAVAIAHATSSVSPAAPAAVAAIPDLGRSAMIMGLLFIGFGLGRILTSAAAQITLSHFSQETTARLRRDLVKQILRVPLKKLESIGTHRLMVTLTEDVMEITQATLSVPIFAVNLAILLGGAAYMGYLNFGVLIGMGVFAMIGAGTYRLFIRAGFGHLVAAREGQDRLFRHFRALTEGIKELKIHRARRRTFVVEDVESAARVCQKHNVAAEVRFIVAQNWNQLLFLTMIGLLLFILPRFDASLTATDLAGYIFVTIYMMGPLAGLLGTLSVFSRANVSLNKVEQLGLALQTEAGDEQPESAAELPELKLIELVKVTHHYHREKEDDHFLLGPIDLTLRPGELVFLVGGNGSGKSTLAKVIAGLYPPDNGEVRLNGRVVGDGNRDDYRQYFSAVFADFHLFDRITGAKGLEVDARAKSYLERLHLDHKVSVKDGEFSTTQLSSGQRKRLALLCAYLEDRPFYLFDEWASDQDPLFKDLFYTQILPELRNRGKAVLVITHDDKYFPLADRLIKLDYGKLWQASPMSGYERETKPRREIAGFAG